jgi:hypothetical protein
MYNGKCDFLVEQMTTVNSWEASFIVPLVDDCVNVIRVLGRDDGTTVKFKRGRTESTEYLDSEEFTDQTHSVDSNRNPVVAVGASRPVLVAHFTGSSGANSKCSPSMTLIPAMNQYMDHFNFVSKAGLEQAFVKVMIQSDQLDELRMNNRTVIPKNRYDALIGTHRNSFAVFEIDVTYANSDTLVNLTHTSGVEFGAIFYGFKQNHGLSFPLGMQLDLSKGEVHKFYPLFDFSYTWSLNIH